MARNANVHMIFSLDSPLRFMEGDYKHSVRNEYDLKMSKEIKLKLLQNLYEDYKNHENKMIHILDTEKYCFHNRFHIDTISDKMINFVNYKHRGRCVENEMTFVYSPVVVKYMKNFYLYLTGSEV